MPFEGEGSRRLKIQSCFEDHIFRPTDVREHFPEDELILGENRLLEVQPHLEPVFIQVFYFLEAWKVDKLLSFIKYFI